jgi:hypothetical protein
MTNAIGGGAPFIPASPGGDLTGVLSRMANNGQQLNQQLGLLIQQLKTSLPFKGAFGTFTATAGTTSTVANGSVAAASIITLMPTNATAATLYAGGWYPSARTAGVSFTLTFTLTAAGSETFSYSITSPS